MTLRRMTIRRWMLAVGVVAFLLGMCIQAQRWRLQTRHADALRGYTRTSQNQTEGRCTPEDVVLASQRLMEAELGLCASTRLQEFAIISHLRRTLTVVDVELEWPFGLHDRPWLEAILIEEALTKSKRSLNEWPHTLEVVELLAECRTKLQRLESKGRNW